MIENIFEQPYRAPADDLVRHGGLNNRLRLLPKTARYFLIDVKLTKGNLIFILQHEFI